MTWTGIHCRLSWPARDVDAFIVDSLAPTVEHLNHSGLITDWYYLRYWETGPHLRVRVRDAEPPTAKKLIDTLRDLIAAADFPVQDVDPGDYYGAIGVSGLPWQPHGDVRAYDYVPETARYGGPDALPVAEDIFCRSTEVACAVLRATSTPSGRLTAAIDLAIATAKALDLGRPAAAAWLRTLATGWRLAREPGPAPLLSSHHSTHRLLATRGADLAERWHREAGGATRHWADAIRAARGQLTGPMLDVWASQLHMLFNRLGISANEERAVCALVAATALRPGGLTSFHDDNEAAPDRAYVEASKFLPGFVDQLPRKNATPPRRAVSAGPTVVRLPEPRPVDVSLGNALSHRRTSHQFTGTLHAEQLATLLWTAHSPGDEHHPYPSAGAQYCARLRLVAFNVDGLEPATYDVDEHARALRRITTAPLVADVEAISMWFGGDVAPLGDTPAILAMYVELGRLRCTYGLRALRFAYAEAGHLAQNLQLVAASTGVRIGLVGGFYDDLANDLFCLDGVNRTLVYLLPVAA